MSSYYYLLAQLPYISFSSPAPFSWDEFVELCAAQMDDKDMRALRECETAEMADDSEPSRVIQSWKAWETELLEVLARERAAKLKRDLGQSDGQGRFTEIPEIVRQACTIENPLEAERFLDAARWGFLDELGAFEFFNREALYVYAFKLRLMLRDDLFNAETGFEAYKSIYASILQDASINLAPGEVK